MVRGLQTALRWSGEGSTVSTFARVITGLGLLAAVAGGLVLSEGGITALVVGMALVGLAAIGFVAVVFLLVGESEDRDRARHPRG